MNFNDFDRAALWDADGYLDIMARIQEEEDEALPLTLSTDTLDGLQKMARQRKGDADTLSEAEQEAGLYEEEKDIPRHLALYQRPGEPRNLSRVHGPGARSGP